MNSLRWFFRTFVLICGFILVGVLALLGVLLVFGSFFFDSPSDWPRNVGAFFGGVAVLTAAWGASKALFDRAWSKV